jgi:hypothetical protein
MLLKILSSYLELCVINGPWRAEPRTGNKDHNREIVGVEKVKGG